MPSALNFDESEGRRKTRIHLDIWAGDVAHGAEGEGSILGGHGHPEGLEVARLHLELTRSRAAVFHGAIEVRLQNVVAQLQGFVGRERTLLTPAHSEGRESIKPCSATQFLQCTL